MVRDEEYPSVVQDAPGAVRNRTGKCEVQFQGVGKFSCFFRYLPLTPRCEGLQASKFKEGRRVVK